MAWSLRFDPAYSIACFMRRYPLAGGPSMGCYCAWLATWIFYISSYLHIEWDTYVTTFNIESNLHI